MSSRFTFIEPIAIAVAHKVLESLVHTGQDLHTSEVCAYSSHIPSPPARYLACRLQPKGSELSDPAPTTVRVLNCVYEIRRLQVAKRSSSLPALPRAVSRAMPKTKSGKNHGAASKEGDANVDVPMLLGLPGEWLEPGKCPPSAYHTTAGGRPVRRAPPVSENVCVAV